MTTPDPITTAREALDKAYAVCRNLPGTDESDFHAIAAALDYAEKLKAERDAEITRLTSQLEQAERVIAPFAENGDGIHEGWADERIRASLTQAKPLTVANFRAASQWIKDRQAKGEG